MSYDEYTAWRRLTNNGRRSREEMSEESREEFDALGLGRGAESVAADEAKRSGEATP